MATTLLQINISSFNNGQQAVAETLECTNSSAPLGGPLSFAFATGDNTLTKPTGANALVLSSVTGTLKLYASTNPTLGASTTIPIVLPVAQSSVVINASAGATAVIEWC